MTITPTLQRLTTQGRALAQRIKPQSASVRNVLKLAGGTAGSQVITVAAAPILTRLYGPESFGVLATFASILALLNVVSSLRYELAIAVPEDDDEAIALVWLCFVLVAISTVLTALGGALLGDQLVSWLHQPALKPLLWLLPVGVLFTGVYQPLSYWAIRRKQFGLLAQTKFRQSIFGVVTNLAAAPLGTIGLLFGQIVSQSAGFVEILRQSASILLRGPRPAPAVLWMTLRRYSHFGIYSSPAGLINTIGNQVPNLIFASAFGAAQLGQLALAQRLLLLPASLISISMGQVFLGSAPKHHKDNNLKPYCDKFINSSLRFSLFLFPYVLFLYLSTKFLFGSEWGSVRLLCLAFLPLGIATTTYSPVSQIFIVIGKNKVGLLNQILITIVKLGSACFAFYGIGLIPAILIYSCARAMSYGTLHFSAVRAINTLARQ